jgi:hypothetical protein
MLLHNGRRLLVGDPQALPALDPRRHLRPRPRQLQHPSPPCPRPQPRALGRGDRLLLDQSVTRSWSSRLRRRQEDRRHQTPRRRGHAGLLVAVLVTAASVQDRAAVPRLLGRARYRCPGARPSVGRAGLHRQRRAGREQDPAVHDPDRRRDQSQGRLYHPASSLGRRADFRLDAPLPTPHRQYEQTLLAHEAMVVISQLALMLRRLDRMTEPRHQDGVVRQALGPLGPRCRGGTPSSRPASRAMARITGSDSRRFQPSTASIPVPP